MFRGNLASQNSPLKIVLWGVLTHYRTVCFLYQLKDISNPRYSLENSYFGSVCVCVCLCWWWQCCLFKDACDSCFWNGSHKDHHLPVSLVVLFQHTIVQEPPGGFLNLLCPSVSFGYGSENTEPLLSSVGLFCFVFLNIVLPILCGFKTSCLKRRCRFGNRRIWGCLAYFYICYRKFQLLVLVIKMEMSWDGGWFTQNQQ